MFGQRNSSDDESIDAQLDRLNQAIESMVHPFRRTKRRSTPSNRKHRTTYSYEPQSTFEDEQSDSCSRDDNFLARVENLAVDYERASMINEDFRSHELNSRPNTIECTQLELYKLHKDLTRLLCLLENGLTSMFCLSVANLQIKIKVKDSLGSKDDAVASFLELWHKAKLKHDMSKAFNKTDKDKENTQFVYLKKCKNALAIKNRICRKVRQELTHQRDLFERALEEYVNGEPLTPTKLCKNTHKNREVESCEDIEELPQMVRFVKEYSKELTVREECLEKEEAEYERRNRELVLKLANVHAKEREVLQETKLLEKEKELMEKKIHMFENSASNLLQCVQVLIP